MDLSDYMDRLFSCQPTASGVIEAFADTDEFTRCVDGRSVFKAVVKSTDMMDEQSVGKVCKLKLAYFGLTYC